MEKAVTENYKKYCERVKLYKSFGYDIEEERNFIIEKSHPLYGDILEVGTGKGYFALALAKEGFDFTSIDISEKEQAIAKLNIEHSGFGKKVNFKIENAESLSFKDKEFDIVFCVNMFHHLETILKSANELMRVVSFEGKIILSDFNKEGIEVIDKVHRSEGRRHQANLIGLKGIEKYFQQKDFNTESYRSKFQDVLVAYHPII